MNCFLHLPMFKNEICRINLVMISLDYKSGQSVPMSWIIMEEVISTLTLHHTYPGKFFLFPFKMNSHSRH